MKRSHHHTLYVVLSLPPNLVPILSYIISRLQNLLIDDNTSFICQECVSSLFMAVVVLVVMKDTDTYTEGQIQRTKLNEREIDRDRTIERC